MWILQFKQKAKSCLRFLPKQLLLLTHPYIIYTTIDAYYSSSAATGTTFNVSVLEPGQTTVVTLVVTDANGCVSNSVSILDAFYYMSM